MPEKRRTRATGFSPGGPQELDINAPTRRSRRIKTPASATPQEALAPAARTTRARPGAKRKNEDDIAEEPAAKKFRLQISTEESEVIASNSQALATLPYSKTELPPGSMSSSQKENFTLESEQLIEPRVNAQQPTPPLDTPGYSSIVQPITKPPQSNLPEDASLADAQRRADRRLKKEKRISDMIRSYRTVLDEEEDAKALSECDDDEWVERYATVMEEARNPTPFIATSKGDFEKWVPGSTAMFVVRKPHKKDIAATSRGDPFAVSASLDWYENNPSITAPTAIEMTSMLDNFARAKQAQQADGVDLVARQTLQNPTTDAPRTPKVQVTSENLAEVLHASESDDGHSNIDDREEAVMEQGGDLTANVHQNKVEATEPQTPQQQDGPQGPRTWSAALSASAIGILTPLNNWFSRRNRDSRNIAATEPRPVRTEPEVTRPAQSHRKPRSRDKPAQPSKTLPEKKILLHNLKTALSPDSPTPTAPQPRRGRPDSHLPVHLRGVLFEDLPAEWQALSEHLKKPQQVQVEDEYDEPVDMEILLAIAKRTRKERERKELQEQAELIAQKQRDLESDDESSGDQMDRKGKKRVTFSPQKKFSAKLGHSTFGMPANIDETSSDEDLEDMGPQTHFGRSSRRSSRPMKSCLKRPYQQPKSEDYNEDDGRDGYEPRPAKKARLDEFVSSQISEMQEDNYDIPQLGEGFESFLYEDDPRRARPLSRFISKPPSELRAAEKAQMEFDRLNPRNRGPLFSALVRKSPYPKDESNRPNVFESGSRIPMEDWSAGFRTGNITALVPNGGRKSRYPPGPYPYGRARRLPESPGRRDENGRLKQMPGHLREASLARLNQQREDAVKHKPKVSSGLQAARTLSPIQEKPSWRNMVLDEEVLQSIASLDDEDIVAEGFGKYPEHAEATVSEEASKAIEWIPGVWDDLTPEEMGLMTQSLPTEPVKRAEVADRAEVTNAV